MLFLEWLKYEHAHYNNIFLLRQLLETDDALCSYKNLPTSRANSIR